MSRPFDDLPSIATEPDLAAVQRLLDAAVVQRRGRPSDRDAEVESLRARVARLTDLPAHRDLDGIVREVDRLPLAFRDMARALLRMAWTAGAAHGAERFAKPPTVVLSDAATLERRGRDAERARVLALIDADRQDLRDARRPDEHRALSALRHAVADGQAPKERDHG